MYFAISIEMNMTKNGEREIHGQHTQKATCKIAVVDTYTLIDGRFVDIGFLYRPSVVGIIFTSTCIDIKCITIIHHLDSNDAFVQRFLLFTWCPRTADSGAGYIRLFADEFHEH